MKVQDVLSPCSSSVEARPASPLRDAAEPEPASPVPSSADSATSSASGTPVTTEMLKRGWIAPFLLHLHQMLRREDPAILRWTDDGLAFQILDKDTMTTQVLPKYFKNKNFASFQRQLNYFGFRKWSKARAEFSTYSREHFTRDNYSAMSLVKRQSKKSRKRPAPDATENETPRDVKRAIAPSAWVATDRCKPILPRPLSPPEVVSHVAVPPHLPALALSPLSPTAKTLAPPPKALVDQPLPVISAARRLGSGCKLPSLHELPLGNALRSTGTGAWRA